MSSYRVVVHEYSTEVTVYHGSCSMDAYRIYNEHVAVNPSRCLVYMDGCVVRDSQAEGLVSAAKGLEKLRGELTQVVNYKGDGASGGVGGMTVASGGGGVGAPQEGRGLSADSSKEPGRYTCLTYRS